MKPGAVVLPLDRVRDEVLRCSQPNLRQPTFRPVREKLMAR